MPGGVLQRPLVLRNQGAPPAARAYSAPQRRIGASPMFKGMGLRAIATPRALKGKITK